LELDGEPSYSNNHLVSGDIERAFKVYSHGREMPAFSHALRSLTESMVALAASNTDNFDKLKPLGHKVRINARDYTPWFSKEHEASWKASYWKEQYEPFIVTSSEAAVDFVVGEIALDDADLVTVKPFQGLGFLGIREKKGPQHTRHRINFSPYTVTKMSDEELVAKGLEIITLEPGQVAMAGMGHIMRRREKHMPGTAYVQLKFNRPTARDYHSPSAK
jgi:hypothetical protein